MVQILSTDIQIKVLEAVKTKLAPRGAWIKNAYSENRSRTWACFSHSDAQRFCLRGAVARCLYEADFKIPLWDLQNNPLVREIELNLLSDANLVVWNDSPSRRKRDVMNLLDNAISRLKSQVVHSDA